MNISPLNRKDFYKVDHRSQYVPGTTLIYSNATCRGSRLPGVEEAVVAGPQYWVIEYLLRQWWENFFKVDVEIAVARYKRRIENALGKGVITYDHVRALHKLQYLPLKVKALPEGTLVPMRVPWLTIRNTHPDFAWLTNMVETNLSNSTWGMLTSATIAFQYRKRFEQYVKRTGFPKEMVKWLGHDFSARGMFGEEATMMSAMGHLFSFTGTDSITGIDGCEEFYGANSDKELIGGSVPATEHSVMCSGGMTFEEQRSFVRRLITEVYPKDIVSIVADTWNYWEFIDVLLPSLRNEIMSRDGKVVVRPDSGDPVKVILGNAEVSEDPEHSGTVLTLLKHFGGGTNEKGCLTLDSHVGSIYGDSITLSRQDEILTGLEDLRIAAPPVLGIGSFTYQYNTRDTFGQAIKATYRETNGRGEAMFKAPKTDSGLKNSAKGLLRVNRLPNGKLMLEENVDWAGEECGELQTIFIDGRVPKLQTLAEIRARIDANFV